MPTPHSLYPVRAARRGSFSAGAALATYAATYAHAAASQARFVGARAADFGDGALRDIATALSPPADNVIVVTLERRPADGRIAVARRAAGRIGRAGSISRA